jgi:hypothetical protein
MEVAPSDLHGYPLFIQERKRRKKRGHREQSRDNGNPRAARLHSGALAGGTGLPKGMGARRILS